MLNRELSTLSISPMSLKNIALACALSGVLNAHSLPAQTVQNAQGAQGMPDAVDLDEYLRVVREANDDPSRLANAHGILLPTGELVSLETGWTRWHASLASKESLRALESRVEVARYARPTAFQPDEIRRRLSSLLDRLYPSRVRALGAAADEPVKVDPTEWRSGYVGSGTGYAGGGSGGGPWVGSGGGFAGGSHGYGGGYNSGSTHASNSRPGNSSGSRGGSHHATHQVQTHQLNQPTASNVNPVQPTTQPAQTNYSRPTEVAVVPPPRPPAVEPPPPPPAPMIKPETKTTSWLTVLMWMLLFALPVVAFMVWRARQKGQKAPTLKPPKSVADLVDPEHVGLGAGELGAIGRSAAVDEDWMRAMRYLFASLLTYLAEQRRAPIKDWHTNREIADLVGRDAKLAESFWSAATIFELFWFGMRRPMENDFRLFETMARDCMSRMPEVGA